MLPHILVFDSGVGGLSIVKELDKHLGAYNLTYLFDNAYFPYGELTEDFLRKRVVELLIPLCNSTSPDLVIIACNTASTVVLSELRTNLSIPVVGVVPAIKPAAACSKKHVIGLLATPATVHRHYIQKLIDQFAKGTQVLRIGSSKLVKLVEGKLSGIPILDEQLQEIMSPWLNNQDLSPDVIVLGCTHFPLIKEQLASLFMGDVQFVDSGVAIANRVGQLLKTSHFLIDGMNIEGERLAYFTKMGVHNQSLWTPFKDYRFKAVRLYSDCLCVHLQDELSIYAAETPAH